MEGAVFRGRFVEHWTGNILTIVGGWLSRIISPRFSSSLLVFSSPFIRALPLFPSPSIVILNVPSLTELKRKLPEESEVVQRVKFVP